MISNVFLRTSSFFILVFLGSARRTAFRFIFFFVFFLRSSEIVLCKKREREVRAFEAMSMVERRMRRPCFVDGTVKQRRVSETILKIR